MTVRPHHVLPACSNFAALAQEVCNPSVPRAVRADCWFRLKEAAGAPIPMARTNILYHGPAVAEEAPYVDLTDYETDQAEAIIACPAALRRALRATARRACAWIKPETP